MPHQASGQWTQNRVRIDRQTGLLVKFANDCVKFLFAGINASTRRYPPTATRPRITVEKKQHSVPVVEHQNPDRRTPDTATLRGICFGREIARHR